MSQSLMPLRFFAPSLQRLLQSAASGDDKPNHISEVEPILLSVRGCAQKYSQDIPEILSQDEPPEEPEAEEALIWYAFNHEQAPEQAEGSNNALDEDTWRKRWLDRMDKREYVCIHARSH
jgi:hypothetical protein